MKLDYETVKDLIDCASYYEIVEIYRNCVNEGVFDEEVFDMCDLDKHLNGLAPSKVALMVVYGNFNPYDNYFKFDGYGNLESLALPDFADYARLVISDNIDAILENPSLIDCLNADFDEE